MRKEQIITTNNNQISLVFAMLGQSPVSFKGGGPWAVIEGIEPVFVAVGSSLVVLFFVIGFCSESMSEDGCHGSIPEVVRFLLPGRQLQDFRSILRCRHVFAYDSIPPDRLSRGGSVTAGFAIYDTMQYVKCDVSTIFVFSNHNY